MRADVNSDMVPGVNRFCIMEGIGEGAGPDIMMPCIRPRMGSFLILILRRPGFFH